MSARATWTGAVSFAMVSVPVKLYSATEEHDISFHQVHAHGDGRELGRINYKKICTVCTQEVPYAEIAKGYDTEEGTVVLDKDEIAAIPLETLSTIDVQHFVPIGSVDPILFERSYTLTPDIPVKAKGKAAGAKAARAYGVLTRALDGSGKVGIVKVTLRQREQLGMLSVRNGRMSLTTLRWADEVREMPEATYPDCSDAELAMASQLIESLSVPAFDGTAYSDGYQKALHTLVALKRSGLSAEPIKAAPVADVVDLMAALRASVEANRQKRELAAA